MYKLLSKSMQYIVKLCILGRQGLLILTLGVKPQRHIVLSYVLFFFTCV